MHHSSVKMDTPIEIVKITPFNPLISKCEIKVCYVSDVPNRNKSIITKEVAIDLANSLPGSPIVGFYDEEKEDFENHGGRFYFKDGVLRISPETQPYGFVDLGAKVWFQKFLDDGINEREYLMTEGWLWTGQFPECRRILEKSNGQSMELDPEKSKGNWTKDVNGNNQFFIINEAVMSKLCILGEDIEPCFEGANITAPTIQFSFGEDFKQQLFSMMNELKQLLNEGGAKVFTQYAVKIGDELWNALYNYVSQKHAEAQIVGVYEEESKVFAVLHTEDKYCRLNFSVAENGEYEFAEGLVEIESYTPDEEPQFSAEEIQNFVENLSKSDKNDQNKSEGSTEDENLNKVGEEKCPKCGNPVSECSCNPAPVYVLEEIPEYIELQTQYSALTTTYNELLTNYNSLKEEHDALNARFAPLAQFKAEAEKKEKEQMIASFYMLSDEDKKDVIDNIDSYTLEDIEAKLSIICVRNRVSFNHKDNQEGQEKKAPVTYNVNDGAEDEYIPAWVKAALKVAEKMN